MNSTAIHAANLSPAPIPFWKTEVECAKDLRASNDTLMESAKKVSALLVGACDCLSNEDTFADIAGDIRTLIDNLDEFSFAALRDELTSLHDQIKRANQTRDKNNAEFVAEIDKADQLLQAMQYE